MDEVNYEKEAELILVEYCAKDSSIDIGNVYFAATVYRDKYQALLEKLQKAKAALRWYRYRDHVISSFEEAYRDDSDSENNAHTNGYFPPRPNDDEVQEFTEWLEAKGPAKSILEAIK